MRRAIPYLKPSEIIQIAKEACNIIYANDQMNDDEIATVMRWIGAQISAKNESVRDRDRIDIMLFVTLMEFPEFYARKELCQFN